MSRVISVSVVALVALSLLAPESEGAVYRGGGPGVKVKFRVVGRKVVEAGITTRLRCAGRTTRHRYRWLHIDWASPEFPIRIGRSGRFEETTPDRPEEEGYGSVEFLKGRVRPGTVTGRFAYGFTYNTSYRDETCMTGRLHHVLRLGSKNQLRFRARR